MTTLQRRKFLASALLSGGALLTSRLAFAAGPFGFTFDRDHPARRARWVAVVPPYGDPAAPLFAVGSSGWTAPGSANG